MNPMVLNATIVFRPAFFTNGSSSNTNSKLNHPQTAIITASLDGGPDIFLKKANFGLCLSSKYQPGVIFCIFLILLMVDVILD
jgi:hypothetical protein